MTGWPSPLCEEDQVVLNEGVSENAERTTLDIYDGFNSTLIVEQFTRKDNRMGSTCRNRHCDGSR